MSAFGGLILTNKGRNLQAKAQLGTALHFTRIALGDYDIGGESILDLSSLKHEVKSLPIVKLKLLSGGKAVVGAVFSNEDMKSGFYWREIGIFANDPENGEILYCYGNAGTNAEYIPAGGGADIIEKSIDVTAIVGNTTNVTATIDQSLIFASQKDIENKVDKVPGKRLSTEDYTTQEKQKLASLSNYSHPSEHPASMIKMGDGSTVEGKITAHLAEIASPTTLGHVKIGSGINVSSSTGVISVVTAPKIKIYDDLTYYVNSNNGNDDNDGLSESSPFKTIQRVFDIMCTGEIIATQLIILCASGTYNAPKDESMHKVFADIIAIISTEYTNANTFMNGYLPVDNMPGKTVRVLRFTFTGTNYAILGQQQAANVYLSQVKAVNAMLSIKLGDSGYLYAENCELKGLAGAIQCEGVGCVTITGSNTKLTSDNGSVIDLSSVGSAKISSVTLVVTAPSANFCAIRAMNATVLHAKGVKGTLGASPIFKSSGSIIFKGSITATGAADVKEEGGQIFAG